jgi:hypothetical protein
MGLEASSDVKETLGTFNPVPTARTGDVYQE